MFLKGWPRADHPSKLSAPIGLDIGAEIPGEIALSIAGEMISVKRGTGVNPHRVHEQKP